MKTMRDLEADRIRARIKELQTMLDVLQTVRTALAGFRPQNTATAETDT